MNSSPINCQKLLLIAGFLFLFTPSLFAQSGQLSGTITDPDAQPLAGINVGLEGTTLGAATDADGAFLINRIPAGTYMVTFTGVGYQTVEKEVTISENSTSELAVKLTPAVLGMNELVVSATRSAETLDEVPASVNILNPEEISDELSVNSDVNDLLAKQVPGFAQSTQSSSNWGQNLRGRDYLVLIDGIPQSTPLRAAGRDLQSIDAGAVSRVEVIKGATAIYGNGATGGLVNYITNLPQKEGLQSVSTVGTNVSLSAPSNSTGYRFSQQLMGRNDRLSYLFNGAFEQKGLYKDAAGDIIPTNPHGQGGLAEASIYNLQGQIGYELSSSHQVEAMYNLYSNDQETDYITLSGTYPDQKATAEKGEVIGENQGTRANHNARINYNWLDIWGETSLEATAYLQDYETVFGYYEGFREGGQSYLQSNKKGLRFNFDSPFSFSDQLQVSAVYGADILSDNTEQKLIDGRTLSPATNMQSIAPYLQVKAIFSDDWVFKGGLRYEDINIDVPGFTTVEEMNPDGSYSGGIDVEGGSLSYSAFTYNAGLSYKKHTSFNPFASVSQGFSVADLGRTLRSATEPTTVDRIDPEPVIVQNYELGVNSSYSIFRGTLSGFVSTSELGASYQENADGMLVVDRSPEIVYGFELDTHIRPTDRLGIGASYTFTEGRTDNDNNGSYTDPDDNFLVNNRISPPKFTSYARYQATSKLRFKASLLHSAERNRFERTADGTYTAYMNNIDSYSTVDLTSTYELPFGSFSLAVENLLNADYYPAISQWAGAAYGTDYAKAPGARVNATFKIQL